MIDTDEKRKNLENGNTGNNNPFPFPGGFPGFPGFFGNMFANAMNQASKAKTRPIEHPLDITLEDIAKNRSINVTISTHKPCDCVDDSNCDNCGGKGTVQQVQRNGMMTMINNSSCQKCNGTGKVGKQNSSCRKCENGLMKSNKIVTVQLDNKRIENIVRFENEGNQDKHCFPGDIVVVLNIKKDGLFTLKNYDLHCEYKVDLKNALMGGKISIPHINGEVVTIEENMITPGLVRTILGKGINSKSSLIIKYDIIFPQDLSMEKRIAIWKILSSE